MVPGGFLSCLQLMTIPPWQLNMTAYICSLLGEIRVSYFSVRVRYLLYGQVIFYVAVRYRFARHVLSIPVCAFSPPQGEAAQTPRPQAGQSLEFELLHFS